MILQLATGTLRTLYGTYREVLFYDGQHESTTLIMGKVTGTQPTEL